MDAAHASERAVDVLTSTGPHPLHAALTTFGIGWTSVSAQRQQFDTDLHDLSGRLLSAFTTMTAELDGAVAREPRRVDPEDPAEAWKATLDAPRAHAV